MPTSKRNKLIGVLLFGMAGGLLAHMSWQGAIVGLVADDAIYVLLADYFSPYSNDLRDGASFIAKNGLFPPGYPLFLALLGADSHNIYYAHVLTTLVILSAFWASARYLFMASGSFLLVIIYVATFFLLPRTLLHNLELMSEPLFLLFSMLALAKYESLKDDRNAYGVCWVAIFVCLATLTRTAGIALLFAFIFWQFASAGKNRVWGAVLLAIVPLLVWEVLKTFVYIQLPNSYSQNLVNSYNLNDAPALLRKIGHHLLDVWSGWRKYIDVTAQFSSLPASILLSVCTLPALFVRLANFRLDAIYFVLYLAMILIWPYTDHTARFLYPIMPLAFFYVVLSIGLLREQKWRAYAHGLVLGLTLLAAVPSTAQIISKAIRRDDFNLGVFTRTSALYENTNPLATIETGFNILQELINAMQISGKMIPANECVYSAHSELFMYYGRRYSRPPNAAGLQSVTLNNSPECRYLLISWSNSHPDFAPGYPLDQINLNYQILYTHWMRLPNMRADEKGMVAQMLLLLPQAPDADVAGALVKK